MDSTLLILFLAAIPIGAWAVVFGATLFLSLPLFQLLFPQVGLAFLVGNIKVGSLFRNAVAVFAAREKLNLKKAMSVALPLVIGTVVGALGVVSLSQEFVLPVLVLAILATEFSGKLQKYITGKVFLVVSLVVGLYAGILGAGISLLLWALLKVKGDHDLANVRTDGLFLEGLLTLVAVVVFFWYGHIDLTVALVWTAGSMIGGYLGGKLIKVSGKWKVKSQAWLLRGSFVVAIGVAVWQLVGT